MKQAPHAAVTQSMRAGSQLVALAVFSLAAVLFLRRQQSTDLPRAPEGHVIAQGAHQMRSSDMAVDGR